MRFLDANTRAIVLVGEAPSSTSGKEPFSGKSGAKIEGVLGWSEGELRSRWRCVNVFDAWPGRDGGKGSRFDSKQGRDRVEKLARVSRCWRPPPVVWIFAGRRVAQAFGIDHATYFEPYWVPEVGGTGFAIPHPSGVNKWWNSKTNLYRFNVFVLDVETVWLDAAFHCRSLSREVR